MFKEIIKKTADSIKELVTGEEEKKRKAEEEERKIKEAIEKVTRDAEVKQVEKDRKEFENYLNGLVDEAKRGGLDDEQAHKWAWNKINKRIARMQSSGQMLSCSVCKQAGSNQDTGGLKRNPDGTYRHQNCGR